VGVAARKECGPSGQFASERVPGSPAAVAALVAAEEDAARACERIQTDRRVVFHPGQMDLVPPPAAILPGLISIQRSVVISSPNTFP
jgi:hypothetical protein